MDFQSSDFEPHWEHVDCAEETSLCQEANKFKWTSLILFRWLWIQPEDTQKLVDGYQMAERLLTKY